MGLLILHVNFLEVLFRVFVLQRLLFDLLLGHLSFPRNLSHPLFHLNPPLLIALTPELHIEQFSRRLLLHIIIKNNIKELRGFGVLGIIDKVVQYFYLE